MRPTLSYEITKRHTSILAVERFARPAFKGRQRFPVGAQGPAPSKESWVARIDEAAKLVIGGSSPASIAVRWGISCASVVQYLHSAVGRGLLRRSDIFFTLGDDVHQGVETLIAIAEIRNRWDLRRLLKTEQSPGARPPAS